MSSFRTIRMRAVQGFAALVLGLFVLTVSAGAALAQAITPEGAAELKADIQRALDRRAASFQNQSEGSALQRDGELTVTPRGSYYAVVLPHLSLKGPQGGTMDIGVIKLNAIPAGQDRWRVTMAVPTPLTGFDATGVPRVKFSIGQQHFTGVWHAKYDTYLETDLNYQDIQLNVNDPQGKAQFQIGTIRGTMNLSEEGEGKFSGPYDFVLENTTFNATDPRTGKPTNGSIARIESRGTMVNVDMKKAIDFQDTMQSRVEGIQDPNNPDPATSKAILGDAMDYMTSFADNFDMVLNLQGLDVNLAQTDTQGATPSPERLQIDKVGFAFNVNGMEGPTLDMKVNYGIEDLSIMPAPPQSQGYLPMTMVFNFTMNDLPHKFLSNMITDKVSADIDRQSGQAAPPTNPGADMMQIKQAMVEHGTVIKLDGTRLSAGPLAAALSGDIRASANSMMGAVADVRLVLKGVDKVMASLSQPGTPPQAMQQGMGMLGMLQSMGKPEVGDDGSNVLVYNLQVTEDGRMLLNGQPMGMPGGGMGGPGMGAPGGPGGQGGMPLP